MILLETKLGNFGNYKDLLKCMNIEGYEELEVKTYYCCSPINKLVLNRKDIEFIINN